MNPTQQLVSKEQLEMQLRYAETELAIWIKHLDAHNHRGIEEREYLKAMWHQVQTLTRPTMSAEGLGRFIQAHQFDYDAKAELIKLNLAKLQSNIDSLKQVLSQIDQKILSPSGFQA